LDGSTYRFDKPVRGEQQVGTDHVRECSLAGTVLRCRSFQAYAQHRRSDVAPVDLDALPIQLVTQLARAREGVLQMQLVDTAHEWQILLADWFGQVVRLGSRAKADELQQGVPIGGATQLVHAVGAADIWTGWLF